MSANTLESSLQDIFQAAQNLVSAQVEFGTKLVDSLSQGTKAPTCCEIPEPCWMPRSLGELCDNICPGSTAVVRFVVHNCDRVARTFSITAAGQGAGLIAISPTNVVIEPKDRAIVTVTFTVPNDAEPGQQHETLIWVRGCKEHYLRWSITVAKSGGCTCHEVAVEDCPDYVHHWYDHFYCARPCLTQAGSIRIDSNIDATRVDLLRND